MYEAYLLAYSIGPFKDLVMLIIKNYFLNVLLAFVHVANITSFHTSFVPFDIIIK